MDSMIRCDDASNSLHQEILKRQEILGKVKIAPNEIDTNSFRIEFIRSEKCVNRIYGLLILFPLEKSV
jgi:hypothetical protein